MEIKTSSNSNTRHLLRIGLFANILEFYEFSIFGLLAGVIGSLFFKAASPILELMQAFFIFAISYLAKPIGALFFGYLSDQYGRSRSLRISLLLMALPTALIGSIPTYQTVGYLGPGLLIILRLIQGFAAGGETPVSAAYVFEAASPKTRSFLCGVVSISSSLGFLLGSACISLLFWYLPYDSITAWAWRLPFLSSIPLTLWIMHIRKGIQEPEISTFIKRKNPFFIMAARKYTLLQAILLVSFSAIVGAYVLSIWMPFYLMHFLQYAPKEAYIINTVMLFILILSALLSAYLSRFIGPRPLVKISVFGILILSYPLFQILQGASLLTLLSILFVFNFLMGGIFGVIFEVLGSLFPQARATGLGMAFTLPTAIFGGFTPFILTTMTQKWPIFPAFYMMSFALLALPAAFKLKN